MCRRSSALLLLAFACRLFAVSSPAAPADEIANAVAVGGAPEIARAGSASFVRAFTAVSFRVPQSELPDYVTAAIQLRPDVSEDIVRTALSVAAHGERGVISPVVHLIIRAAITANPRAAVAITGAAVAVDPVLRSVIVAAAISVAPEQRSEIESIAVGYSLASLDPKTAALLRGEDHIGTLNPANVFDPKAEDDNEGVRSPERPPTPSRDSLRTTSNGSNRSEGIHPRTKPGSARP